MSHNCFVTALGVRGSYATPDYQKMKFGGNTSCYLFRFPKKMLLIDCGTGAANVMPYLTEGGYAGADILLSHMHFDHVQGIPFFDPFFRGDLSFRIFSEEREGKNVQEQIDLLMRGPLFPVSVDSFQAKIGFHTFQEGETLELGEGILIDTMRSNHKNICTLFRIRYEDLRICTLFDYEHSLEEDPRLLDFVKGADLVIYDAAYSECDYYNSLTPKSGFGHSTWYEGVCLTKKAHIKKMLFTHMNPNWTDEALLEVEREAQKLCPDVMFAREGLTLEF